RATALPAVVPWAVQRGRHPGQRVTSRETPPAWRARGSPRSNPPLRAPAGGTPRYPWSGRSGAHDAHAQLREIGPVGGHEVGEPHGAHARGGAGEDEVAGLEVPCRREVRDHLWNFPDEIGDPALLAANAIHIQSDLHFRDVLDPCRRGNAAHGCRAVESLGDAPRSAELLRLALQVAPCHVEPHGVAVDAALRVVLTQVGATLAHGNDQLDLVVQLAREAGIAQYARLTLGDREDGIGGFHEEERRLAAGGPHLLRVVSVVPSDTVHAVHGEPPGRADDPHCRMRRRSEDISHVRTIIGIDAENALRRAVTNAPDPPNPWKTQGNGILSRPGGLIPPRRHPWRPAFPESPPHRSPRRRSISIAGLSSPGPWPQGWAWRSGSRARPSCPGRPVHPSPSPRTRGSPSRRWSTRAARTRSRTPTRRSSTTTTTMSSGSTRPIRRSMPTSCRPVPGASQWRVKRRSPVPSIWRISSSPTRSRSASTASVAWRPGRWSSRGWEFPSRACCSASSRPRRPSTSPSRPSTGPRRCPARPPGRRSSPGPTGRGCGSMRR